METKNYSRKKQIMFGCVVGVGIIIFLGLIKFFQIKAAIAQHASFKMPPEAVTTVIAQEQAWPEQFESSADIAPTQGVVLRNEVVGTVSQIHVNAGDKVEAGQPLISLDASVEQAQLLGAEAELQRADKSFRRSMRLSEEKALSQDALEGDRAAFTLASATVNSLKASIAKKNIVAPFAGTVGVRMANLGQYVEAGSELMPLQSVEKLFLNFSVPQRALPQLQQGAAIQFHVDAFPEQTFEAKLETINPQVEMMTRLIKLQATYDNAKQFLRPGMFANVSLQGKKIDNFITIPSTSVQYTPYATTVFIVDNKKAEDGSEQKTAASVSVKLGARRGDQVAVLSGLTAGQEVVSSGVFKLRPGVGIVPNPAFKVGESAKPQPQDS